MGRERIKEKENKNTQTQYLLGITNPLFVQSSSREKKREERPCELLLFPTLSALSQKKKKKRKSGVTFPKIEKERKKKKKVIAEVGVFVCLFVLCLYSLVLCNYSIYGLSVQSFVCSFFFIFHFFIYTLVLTPKIFRQENHQQLPIL